MKKFKLRYFRDMKDADVFVDRQIARRKRVSMMQDDGLITVYAA